MDYIFELASIPKSNARLEEPPSSTQAKTVRADKAPKIQAAPYPGAARILDRPYQNLSGRRHVPVLVNANKVPFLRIKKPQPPLLGRIIRNIVRTRNHRILKGERLANELSFAQDEEVWDHILYELGGLDSRNLLEPRWQHEVKRAIDDNQQLRIGAIQRRADVSAKMHAIVEKEMALAQERKLRIRTEKHKAYKARRLARKGPGDSEIQKGLDSQMEKTVILDAPTMTEAVLDQDQQEVRPPYRVEVTQDKPTTAKEVLNEDQQEVRPPFKEEVTLKKLTRAKEVLNQGRQEAYRGEVNEPITTEEVLNQGRQEDRPPYTEEGMRKRSDKFKTLDELKQLYESIRPKTDEEITKIEDARARRKEGESERKAQKLKQKQEKTAYLEQRVNEDVEGPTNKQVGSEEAECWNEALSFPRREWSARRRVDRRGDLELDVLCQRLFETSFRGIQRSSQF